MLNFPENPVAYDNIVAFWKKKEKTIQDIITQKRSELEEIQRQFGHNALILKTLDELRNSWRRRNLGWPGHWGGNFFLRHTCDSGFQRVVASELLPEGVVCSSAKEWEEYKKTVIYPDKFQKVPFYFPVVKLSEIARGLCKECQTSQPMMENYFGSSDISEMDRWIRRRYVFCVSCGSFTEISSETSRSHFYPKDCF